jgi:four helix bundle protein
MATAGFEILEVYKLVEQIADEVWDLVTGWKNLAKDTVGKQLIRAADSIGANIAEGEGRYHYKDNCRFVRIARGSLNETRHWLRRAYKRKLLTQEQTRRLKPLIAELAPRLNAYLRSLSRRATSKRRPHVTSSK